MLWIRLLGKRKCSSRTVNSLDEWFTFELSVSILMTCFDTAGAGQRQVVTPARLIIWSPLKTEILLIIFGLWQGWGNCLREHARTANNFSGKIFRYANLSLLLTYFRLFQRRLRALGPRTPDLEYRAPDTGPLTSGLGSRTTDPEPRTPDPGPRTTDSGPRTPDHGLQTLDS